MAPKGCGMNFNQLHFLPYLITGFILYILLLLNQEKKFFNLIKTYWFYKRSTLSYISTFFAVLGMAGLLLSLLDLRGPEEKIKTEVPTDRTIILIDTSASMLAEDVKPSRLQKAALIAKHFARKAAGHQLSIVAFAEIQKKIVPFTNDLDLIDARLDSLKTLRNHYGSSALSLAIQESIQYFQETGGEARGNILIFTDGEETAEGIDLKIPKNVHVALVGVGTSQGGRIPLDDGRGFRYGYKKEKGRDIITSLNEVFFKKVSSDIPSAKYWLANSYSLPSEEILEFFNGEKEKGKNNQDMVIRPVLLEWILIPSLLFLLLSYLLKSIRVFTLGLLFLISPVYSQEEAPKLSPETVTKLDQLQKGKLNKLDKIKLADDLLKSGAKEESLILFKEGLRDKVDPSIPPQAYLNYGTALLEKGDVKEGLEVYKKLRTGLDESTESKKIKEMMDKNVLSYFQQQEQQKKEKSKGKDQEQEKEDKKNQGGSNNDQQKKQDGKSGKQDQNNKKSDDDVNQNPDKKKNNKDKEKENKEDEKDKDKSEQEKNRDEGKKPLPPQKIPAKLKQLMSDDRQLQMKMIENGTKDLNRRKSRKSKDW
jgi:Ca-activated chloride channel family protein